MSVQRMKNIYGKMLPFGFSCMWEAGPVWAAFIYVRTTARFNLNSAIRFEFAVIAHRTKGSAEFSTQSLQGLKRAVHSHVKPVGVLS